MSAIHRILSDLVRNKELVMKLLDVLKPEELEQGRFSLPATFFNEDLEPWIMANGLGQLSSYRLDFDKNYIRLRGAVQIKQLGPVEVDYQFQVTEFRFGAGQHRIVGRFVEKIVSNGNLAQKLALKAASVNGSCLKMACGFLKTPFLAVEGHDFLLDLDLMDGGKKIPGQLTLEYLGAEAGSIGFAFDYGL